MQVKHKIITGYLIIALLFGMYGTFFGEHSQRGFFFNIGKGLVWPAIMFPSLGLAFGSIIMVGVVILVLIIK